MKHQEIIAQHKAKFAAHLVRWEAICADFPILFQTLEDLKVDPSFNITDGCVDLTFAGDHLLLQSVWKALRTAGYKPSTHPGPKDKTNFATFWYFQGDTRQETYPRIWLYFTSKVCKAVKVGVRMVEEAVYEVTCGDGQTPLGELLSSENDNPQARE